MASKMDSKKKSKLAKLQMPKAGHDEEDLLSQMDPEEASESPADEKQEEESGLDTENDHEQAPGETHDLSACSDEDLMAEIKKRGLMSQLEHGDQSESQDSQDQYS